MKPDKKLEMIFNDVFWRCGDCNNIYSLDIKCCPNELLDAWIVNDIINIPNLDHLGY